MVTLNFDNKQKNPTKDVNPPTPKRINPANTTAPVTNTGNNYDGYTSDTLLDVGIVATGAGALALLSHNKIKNQGKLINSLKRDINTKDIALVDKAEELTRAKNRADNIVHDQSEYNKIMRGKNNEIFGLDERGKRIFGFENLTSEKIDELLVATPAGASKAVEDHIKAHNELIRDLVKDIPNDGDVHKQLIAFKAHLGKAGLTPEHQAELLALYSKTMSDGGISGQKAKFFSEANWTLGHDGKIDKDDFNRIANETLNLLSPGEKQAVIDEAEKTALFDDAGKIAIRRDALRLFTNRMTYYEHSIALERQQLSDKIENYLKTDVTPKKSGSVLGIGGKTVSVLPEGLNLPEEGLVPVKKN